MPLNKDKLSISSFMMMVIIICLSLAKLGTCSNLNETLNYTDCTPQRNCLSCQNQYICKQCAPLQKCCPKRCISCSNDTTCVQCEPGFQIRSLDQKGWKVCANSDGYNNIDYHRIKANNSNQNLYYPSIVSTKCQKGYYYENDIKFCQKCRVKNCQSCKDSIHCFICENGFFLFNGICLTWADIKQTVDKTVQNNTTNNSSTQTQVSSPIAQINKEDQGQVYLFFTILGLLLGSCFTCILLQICSCIKGCCRKCYRKLFSDEQVIVLTDDEINKYREAQIQGKNDKRVKISQRSEVNDNYQSQCVSDAVITQSQSQIK